jgi:hypothetical protein
VGGGMHAAFLKPPSKDQRWTNHPKIYRRRVESRAQEARAGEPGSAAEATEKIPNELRAIDIAIGKAMPRSAFARKTR